MTKLVTFGLLCAAALVVAAYARDDRRCVFTVASVVAVNWLLFAMPWIYNPASLAHLLVAAGLDVQHADMWALADLVSMIAVILVCRHLWWAPILWSPYLVTLSMLAVAWANDLEYVEYSNVLDAAVIIQFAAIFMLGGGGCADRLSSCRSRLRGLRHRSRKLAHSSEVAR